MQVKREYVDDVGYVLTFDVPHSAANLKKFRTFMADRTNGAYAVTDAPMVQLEMFGERWVPIEAGIGGRLSPWILDHNGQFLR